MSWTSPSRSTSLLYVSSIRRDPTGGLAPSVSRLPRQDDPCEHGPRPSRLLALTQCRWKSRISRRIAGQLRPSSRTRRSSSAPRSSTTTASPGSTSRARSCSRRTRTAASTEAFTPDFFLPEQDLYLEVTVMKQSLVTRKNRKLRKLRERYPDVQREALLQARHRASGPAIPTRPRLLATPGRPPSPTAIGEVYLSADEIARACRASSARRSARTTPGREPILVGCLKSSFIFLADLSRALPIVHRVDFVELAGYGGAQTGGSQRDPPAQGPRSRHRRPGRPARRGRRRHRADAALRS